jgi:transmembrane sensor
MNNPLCHPDPIADEQASLWAARLDGSVLSPADHHALNAWLAESPAHRGLLSRYCQFSADLEQQLSALVDAGAIAMPPQNALGRRRRYLPWLTATALAAAAAVAIVVWLNRPGTQSENLATSVAQRQSLTLADGTRVELNARTSLRIDITRGERRVQLAGGEAFFVVSKNKARPFIVDTPAGSVGVTGTTFGVCTETASALEVTVVEGSVLVRPGEAGGRPVAPVSLNAGDRLSSGPQGVSVQALSAKALEDAMAWRQGQIVFDGVPLREALARFARYHGRGITTTAGAAELRLGGRFSLDDLDGFFAALEQVLPVRVTRDLSGNVQVGMRDER